MTVGRKGSNNILILSVGEELDALLWGAYRVCKEDMAKSYVRGLKVEGVLSASISILF